MKTLIAEDDLTSRLLLHGLLKRYGQCDVVTNGRRALEAVSASLQTNALYDLICLDIMMPEMDGRQALKEIRLIESRDGRPSAKVLMTTALRDKDNVLGSFREQADGYLIKPIQKAKLLEYLRSFELDDGTIEHG
jgi:two-component system, chemotaxis family, chemotaxis protein CheY